MSTTARIKKFLKSLPPDTLIRNSDLSQFANRALYDKVLSNEFKAGNLTRLTSGVYTKAGSESPSRGVVAAFKTKGFGKTIYPGASAGEYYTDGPASSFQFQGKTIKFIRKSPRRLSRLSPIHSTAQSAEMKQPLSSSRIVSPLETHSDEKETRVDLIGKSKAPEELIRRITSLCKEMFELAQALFGQLQQLSNRLPNNLPARQSFDDSIQGNRRDHQDLSPDLLWRRPSKVFLNSTSFVLFPLLGSSRAKPGLRSDCLPSF